MHHGAAEMGWVEEVCECVLVKKDCCLEAASFWRPSEEGQRLPANPGEKAGRKLGPPRDC